MNPPCARGKKTVYPTEKLNCLDKIWHKLCFKCESCGMTLNMKNYKGYKKLPYCNAHYPTTSFTAVADTPENMRIKKNTSNQSGVVYQKEFAKEKGKFTSVTDDPETMRSKKTQLQASGIAYRGTAPPGSRESDGKFLNILTKMIATIIVRNFCVIGLDFMADLINHPYSTVPLKLVSSS